MKRGCPGCALAGRTLPDVLRQEALAEQRERGSGAPGLNPPWESVSFWGRIYHSPTSNPAPGLALGLRRENKFLLPSHAAEEGGGERVRRNKGRGGTENNNCLNGKREGEGEEKRAVELFLSIPRNNRPITSPKPQPPLPSPEKNWSPHSCASEKNIFIYIRESALLNWFVGPDKTSLCALSARERMVPQCRAGRGSAFGELWADHCNFI